MKMDLRFVSFGSAAACVTAMLVTGASAQVATSIVSQGDTFGTLTVDAFDRFNTNTIGGFAITVSDATVTQETEIDDDTGLPVIVETTVFEEFVVGSVSDLLAPTLLATQNATFDDFVGGADISNTGVLATRRQDVNGLDAVLRGEVVVAIENSPIAAFGGSGDTYRVPNRVQITPDGTAIHFVSSINPSGGGGASGLFTDDGATAEIAFFFNDSSRTTDFAVGDDTFQALIIDQDYEFSADGSNYITKVDLSGLPSSARDIVAVNGAAITSSGSAVFEGEIVPVASGGDGVFTWDNFDFFGITDTGTTLFTGETNTDIELLAIDGIIELKEGDVTEFGTITGNIGNAELANSGDWAASWELDGIETILFNGAPLISVGDSVDTDGDGLADALLTAIDSGQDTLSLTTGADGDLELFFLGTSDLGGDALFQLTVPEPTTAALIGLGGLALLRRRSA